MKAGRIVRRTAGVLALAVFVFFTIVPTGRYLIRAGWAEARILTRARPIVEVVRDSTTDAATRRKLELVLDARAFARDSVKLNAKRGFTTYSHIDHDTLVVVLSAAYRDRLRYKTWWFPIVGSVPYKGYFDVHDAKRAAADLSRDGFDAYLRPASAFSTLGYLEDPVLSTTIDEDSVELVNTVIHELTHNTFYAARAGGVQRVVRELRRHARRRVVLRGARRQRARRAGARGLGTPENARPLLERRVQQRGLRIQGASARARRSGSRAREIVFAGARERFAREIEPSLPGYDPSKPVALHLDNAALMSRRMYRTGLDDFDAIYEREGERLPAAITRIIALARSRPKDPYAAIRAYVASGSAETPAK